MSRIAAGGAYRRPRARLVGRVRVLICLAGVGILGCLGGGDGPTSPHALSDPDVRSQRIVELRQAIALDHRMLENLISQPGRAADESLHEDPELRAIAARLTEQERELEELTSIAVVETAPGN